MNQIAEDATPDEEIASTLSIVEPPKSELMRPEYSFKGVELFPYAYGYEILFNQVRDAEDTRLYTWLAFVFMLRRRNEKETWKEHRQWARGLAWRVDTFRDALMDWMDEIGPFKTEDKIEAKRIYEENMKVLAETAVEAIPTRVEQTQKKTSRRRKQSSSMSSGEN